MSTAPAEIRLELTPRARVDVIDVTGRILEEFGGLLGRYRRALYCSHHTTAGYLEQSLCARLDHDRERLSRFLRAFQGLFPPGAGYQHDRLELRRELSDEQRRVEPRNADSHLTFIGAGLRNCVTYVNRPDVPVFFIDLDGKNGALPRTRLTTVLAFDREREVAEASLAVPVSGHPVDAVNLKDPRLGVIDRLNDLLRVHGIAKGRVDLALEPEETQAGLTVNEYETLLMRHDLAEVLKDPVRHVAERGRGMLRNPRAIPSKALNYAHYDLVQVLNELMDCFGVSESFVERLVARVLGAGASRILRLKRSVSLLVSDHEAGQASWAARASRHGTIVQGTYQSPILLQWRKPAGRTRRLRARLLAFE